MLSEKPCVLSVGFFHTFSSCISQTEDQVSQVTPRACYFQRKISGRSSIWSQIRWISDCTTMFKTEKVKDPYHWSERVSSKFLECVLKLFLKHSWVFLGQEKNQVYFWITAAGTTHHILFLFWETSIFEISSQGAVWTSQKYIL